LARSDYLTIVTPVFIPFHVDFVTTRQLTDRFGEVVQREAKRWI